MKDSLVVLTLSVFFLSLTDGPDNDRSDDFPVRHRVYSSWRIILCPYWYFLLGISHRKKLSYN